MYIGSVKFFKHLIITVLLLLIIVPTVLCIVFGVQGMEKDREILALRAEISALKGEEPSEEGQEEEIPQETEEKASESETVPVAADTKISFSVEDEPEESDTEPAATTAPVSEEAVSSTSASVTTTTAATTTAATTTTTKSTTAVTTKPPEADGDTSYEELYPELYAYGATDIKYVDDKDYVYLTFDDGPSKYTENILYYLDLYDIKATFFVIPDGTETCNNRLKRIVESGHTIGIHTACHDYEKIYKDVKSYLEDFNLAYTRVYEATGVKCRLFRFPGGSVNDFNEAIRDDIIEEMTRRGFIYFDWNVDSRDAMGADWTEMYNTVLGQTAEVPRAIILMHDYGGGYNTILVLEDIIRALIADSRNFKLDKLSENVRPIQF